MYNNVSYFTGEVDSKLYSNNYILQLKFYKEFTQTKTKSNNVKDIKLL